MFTHSISAKPQQRPKNSRLLPLLINVGKQLLPLHGRRFKSLLFNFFALIFFSLTLAMIFVSASFLPKVSKVKKRGWKWNFGLRKCKNWQGSAKLSLLSLLPQPSEFCNDENNSVIRSAMDALRNSKNSLLAVAVFFLFTFFNLILDAPRKKQIHFKVFQAFPRNCGCRFLNIPFGVAYQMFVNCKESGYVLCVLCFLKAADMTSSRIYISAWLWLLTEAFLYYITLSVRTVYST